MLKLHDYFKIPGTSMVTLLSTTNSLQPSREAGDLKWIKTVHVKHFKAKQYKTLVRQILA